MTGYEECGTCRFWRPYHEGAEWGECRRMPPSVGSAVPGSRGNDDRWPHVRQDEWCGEYRMTDAERDRQSAALVTSVREYDDELRCCVLDDSTDLPYRQCLGSPTHAGPHWFIESVEERKRPHPDRWDAVFADGDDPDEG